jgi:hypothetical protein
MWRFLMPAVVMVGALVVLLAGALGDGKSLPSLSTEFAALIASVAPNRTAAPTMDGTPAPHSAAASPYAVTQQPGPAAPIQQPGTDALQQQVAELQTQIAQRSKELGELRSNEDAAHHDLDTLQQQRKDEEAAVARLKSQQQQLAAAPPPATEPSAVAAQQKANNESLQRQATELQAQIKQRSEDLGSLGASVDQAHRQLDALRQQRQADEAAVARLQSQQVQSAAAEPSNPTTRSRPEQQAAQPKPAPAPAPTTAMQATLAELRAKERVTQRPPQQTTQPTSVPSQNASTQPVLIVSTRGVLVTARELLASGRAADARQLLMKAQAESTLHPVTPDQPLATGRSTAAIQIHDAIRLLDAGNTGSALQAINLAMDSTRDGPGGWPSNPQDPRSYGYSASPPNYNGDVRP